MNMQEIDITDSWSEISLGDVLKYEQPYKYAVNDSQFNAKSGTPVLTAGKSFILGYTNETSGIYLDLPVIIFDDFTTDCKYVDFPFKVKSSAMKFLKEKNKNEVDLKFMFEILQSVKLKTTGGDHKRRWISEYSKIKVKIPKYKEQTRIAQILSTADKAIEQTEKLIAKYQRIKAGLMQDLLAKGIDEHGRIRSKATHRFVVKNGIEVPEEWEVVELKELGKVVTGSTPPVKDIENYGEEFFFITPADVVEKQYIDFTERNLTKKGFSLCRPIPANSICVVCIGSTIGKISMTKQLSTSNQQINSLIPYDFDIADFYYYSMKIHLETQLRKEAGLQAVPIVNKSSFSKMILPIPKEKEERRRIINYLNESQKIFETYRYNLNKLQSLKTALMQDLLSGRVRVKLPETEHEKEKQNA